MPAPSKDYTVQIPYLTDVIRLPGIDNAAAKRERIIRWQKSHTALPDDLKWIPRAINKLDDIQDELSVALTLLKWIAPRALPRLIPGLGWALVANDTLNLATSLLSTATTGRPAKRAFLDTVKLYAGGRAARLARVGRYMNYTSLLGFAATAPQVLYSLTGYGLVLGGIMGAITDTVWGAIRVAQGAQLTFTGPMLGDGVTIKGRLGASTLEYPALSHVASGVEGTLLTIGHAIAAAFDPPSGLVDLVTQRWNDIAGAATWAETVWQPTSRAVLAEFGYNPDDPVGPIHTTDGSADTWAALLADAHANIDGYEQRLADASTNAGDGFAAYNLATQAAENIWSQTTATPDDLNAMNSEPELACGRFIEFNIFPPPEAAPDQVKELTRRLIARARATDRRASQLTWQDTAIETTDYFGGYTFWGPLLKRQWYASRATHGAVTLGCAPPISDLNYETYLDERHLHDVTFIPSCAMLYTGRVVEWPDAPTPVTIPGGPLDREAFTTATALLSAEFFNVLGYEVTPPNPTYPDIYPGLLIVYAIYRGPAGETFPTAARLVETDITMTNASWTYQGEVEWKGLVAYKWVHDRMD